MRTNRSSAVGSASEHSPTIVTLARGLGAPGHPGTQPRELCARRSCPYRRGHAKLLNELNLHMPAEWEPHEATWLGWPHELTDWPSKFAPIPWAFAEIVRHLTRVERVNLLVENHAARSRVKEILRKSGADLDAIAFFDVPTDRGWMRDSGPIGVVTSDNAQQRTALLNFGFNGWAKYDDYKKDANVVARLASEIDGRPHTKQSGAQAREPLGRKSARVPKGENPGSVILPMHQGRRVVLEGGSIDVNGRGTLLATEECLLSGVQERNPGFTRDDYAEVFRRYLGVTNVLWLHKGIAGDDTHGHVDDLARFVNASTVVTAFADDSADANYEPLAENLALLRSMKDQDGNALRVETLPMPEAVVFDGQRLPASYANFYIANKIVLVPTFNDPADRIALDKLAALFPDRAIAPVYCRDLVLGLGTIHCMTQQLPRP
jgi:agmatine deiminase